LVTRISGRFHCVECGTGYNDYFKKPLEEGICDVCGSSVFARRPDDAAETVKERLRLYTQQTAPLLSYYAGKGVLKKVNGMQDMVSVSEEIRKIIEGA